MRYKFINFMRGRYGNDELNKFLLYFYIGLFIINLLIDSYIISLIELIFVGIIIFRSFSKKIYKRRKENINFLELKKRIKNFIKGTDNDYVYKKCHKCKKILRLPVPSERGIKKVICPVCKNNNKFFVWQKVKVEIIKNKQR